MQSQLKPKAAFPVPAALGFYFFLGWVGWAGTRATSAADKIWPQSPLAWPLALGLGLGVAVVTTSIASRLPSLRGAFERLAGLIQGLSLLQIFALSVASGLGEELFFRGLLQASLGIFGASFLFALAHAPLERELWPWTIWAGVLGLGLAAWVEVGGGILPAGLAHAALNARNLAWFQGREDWSRGEGLGSEEVEDSPIP